MITTTAPLKDVVPSLDAILTHAVPSTQDPYQVATPYLKLYDVQLTDIPWNTWKNKFKPVDIINEVPPSEPIALPKLPDTQAPSENVLQEYNSQYVPGMSVRLWLMTQLDGGGCKWPTKKNTWHRIFSGGATGIVHRMDFFYVIFQ
jgi:hypothetical protein